MFEFPPLPKGSFRTTTLSQFGGIDWRAHPSTGSFADCQNLVSRYPCMQVLPPLQRDQQTTAVTDVIPTSYGLLVIANGVVRLDGTQIGTVQHIHHQWARMGKLILLLPDKVVVDCAEQTLLSLEHTTTQSVTLTDGSITLSRTAEFRAGDGITLSGCDHAENNKTVVVQALEGKVLTLSPNCLTPESGTITLTRSVPDLDYLCVHNNRVWGTYADKICCSKLGDPYNWQVFSGLSTDSYELQVATPGDFTACASYGTRVLFFKEDCVHKIFGDKPSNFQQTISHFAGVQDGCADSLLLDQEVLYWWSKRGLMQYEGGVPSCISTALGERTYTCTAIARKEDVLWLGMQGTTTDIFTFDLQTRVLLAQNLPNITRLCPATPPYLVKADGIYTPGDTVEDNQPWHMLFSPFLRAEEEKIFPQRLSILLDLPAGSTLYAQLARDDGDFQTIYTATATQTLRKLRIPLTTGRCQRLQVRLSGTGDMVLRNLILTCEKGSER